MIPMKNNLGIPVDINIDTLNNTLSDIKKCIETGKFENRVIINLLNNLVSQIHSGDDLTLEENESLKVLKHDIEETIRSISEQ
jgi:hypothetical protein